MKFSFDKEKIVSSIKGFRLDKPTLKKMLPYFLELLLLAFIITFDLTMKDYLFKFLSYKSGMNMVVIDGFFGLNYSENTGAGFGLFKDGTMALTIVTAIVIACVIGYLIAFRSDSEWLRIPLIMIAGGGIGNLVDRIALGYVRDFFEFLFVDFAIFNIADAFVTVGAIWLVLYLLISIIVDVKKKKAEDNAAETPENSAVISTLDSMAEGESDSDADAEDSKPPTFENACVKKAEAENKSMLDTGSLADAESPTYVQSVGDGAQIFDNDGFLPDNLDGEVDEDGADK